MVSKLVFIINQQYQFHNNVAIWLGGGVFTEQAWSLIQAMENMLPLPSINLRSTSPIPCGLAVFPSYHRLSCTCVWVRLPQVTMLSIYPNMTLAVEWDIKPQL